MNSKTINDIKALLASAHGMTDVMSRLRTDVGKVLDETRFEALNDAVARCQKCAEIKACEAWLANTEEGEGAAPPAFCPVRDYLGSCARDRQE